MGIIDAVSLLSALQPEKFAALCGAFDSPPTNAGLAAEIERHMARWQKIVDCAGFEFAAMLGDKITLTNQVRSAPAASDPDPSPAEPKASARTAQNRIREDYQEDPRFALDDAQRALGFLHDIVGNLDPGRGDLGGIDPDNMAGFLRLVMAQFPMA